MPLPDSKGKTWDEFSIEQQSMLLAYEQIRQYEEADEISILATGRHV